MKLLLLIFVFYIIHRISWRMKADKKERGIVGDQNTLLISYLHKSSKQITIINGCIAILKLQIEQDFSLARLLTECKRCFFILEKTNEQFSDQKKGIITIIGQESGKIANQNA